jgi:hypothetical protein
MDTLESSGKPGAAPAPDRRFEWQGVGSCAASACHGGNSWEIGSKTAYTTWIDRDPHARASAVLDRELAHQIEALIGPGSPARPAVLEPRADPRCLNCHVHVDETSARHATTFSRQDGVSCESCHGPAQRWLEPHALPPWRQRPPDTSARRALGMIPTKDLTTRAALCAGCHVGGPGREVGHDLIAAGHPRLDFELTSKLTTLPRHWDETAERRSQPDREARTWAIGQVASALAAAEVLRARAEAARNEARNWPEFAEYDCFACHHDLTVPSWRQGRSAGIAAGMPGWGPWYWPMTRALARHSRITVLEGPEAALTKLGREMGRTLPDPGLVAATAGHVAGELKSWLARDPGQLMADNAGEFGLLVGLAREGRTLDGPAWDQVEQLCRALEALVRARVDRREPHDPDLETALLELGRQLQLPRGYHSRHDRGPPLPNPVAEALERFLSAADRAAHDARAR